MAGGGREQAVSAGAATQPHALRVMVITINGHCSSIMDVIGVLLSHVHISPLPWT